MSTSVLHVYMGGTFDPIHHGHLRAALELAHALSAQTVHLVPNANPSHRSEPRASFEQRMAMLQLAIVNHPVLHADDREGKRFARTGEAIYTIDTLRELRSELGRDTPIAWVLGSDQLAALDTWKEWQRLLDVAHLVVVRRPDAPRVPANIDAFLAPNRASRAKLMEQPAGYFTQVDIPQLSISATRIREMVGARRSSAFLLPDSVLRFIDEHQLYRK